MVLILTSAAHRMLLSFPTRRSSDLACAARAAAMTSSMLAAGRPKAMLSRSETENKNARSEEHTSELQSRFEIVCRLLLEKNKLSRIRGTRFSHCSKIFHPVSLYYHP